MGDSLVVEHEVMLPSDAPEAAAFASADRDTASIDALRDAELLSAADAWIASCDASVAVAEESTPDRVAVAAVPATAAPLRAAVWASRTLVRVVTLVSCAVRAAALEMVSVATMMMADDWVARRVPSEAWDAVRAPSEEASAEPWAASAEENEELAETMEEDKVPVEVIREAVCVLALDATLLANSESVEETD